jgi:exopolysaccharide biosynthesis polyprenyl glycosylphosphotransferase
LNSPTTIEAPVEFAAAHSATRRLIRWLAVGCVVSDVAAVGVGMRIGGLYLHAGARPLVLVPLLWLAVFGAFGLYRVGTLPAWEEFRRVVVATTVGLLLIVTVAMPSRDPLSRTALSSLLVLLLELLVRKSWRHAAWRLEKQRRLSHRTLIVGTNREAATLAESLADSFGYVPVGHVLGGPGPRSLLDSIRPVGDVSELEGLIREYGASCVLVASSDASRETLLRVARACRRQNVQMRVSANLPEVLVQRVSVDTMGGVMTIAVKRPHLTRVQTILKRLFDIAVASTALLLTLPLMAVIWVAIRVTSPGSALFHQERVTKDFKRFRVHKFRTMVADADGRVEMLPFSIDAPFFKVEGDPRVTRLGRVLRKFSLDEIPQLWNVIRGDMSLVGPRPLRVEQVTANEATLGTRHEVKAGMTGWWQIKGRSNVEWTEAVKMDAFYIENWSLALDVYILLKTVGAVMTPTGAY